MSNGSRPPVPWPYELCRDASAQSETLGAVLMIGITVFGAIGVVAFGAVALNDTERNMEIQAAEHTLTQMDAQFAEVALGEASSKTAQLPRTNVRAEARVVEDGWIKMEIINKTTGEPVDGGDPVFNESLGAVVYENGETTLAYQGGGVWKKSGENSTMVSPPEFHFRGETLTLPVIQIVGDGRVDGSVTIKKGGEATRVYPDPSKEFENPFTGEDRRVNITIGSDYYEAWGAFFETRTSGKAHVNHENNTVTLELVAELDEQTIEAGIGATAAGGTLEFKGGGPPDQNAFTDSYNSSEGPYGDSSGWNGTIVTAGSVDIAGNAEIRGNIRTGGTYEQTGTSEVHGDVFWTDNYDGPNSGGGGGGGPGGPGGPGGAAVHNGTDEQIDGVPGPNPIDSFVDEQVAGFQSSNDNDESAGTIQDERLEFNGVETLEEGSYYLKDLTVPDGETLVLDTTGGNISIGVRDYMAVRGTIEVVDSEDYRVQIYVKGESTTGGNHLIMDGGKIEIPGDKSPNMWVFGKRNFDAEIIGGAEFRGVIYAPSTSEAENPGEIKIGSGGGGKVFGGIVAGSTSVWPFASIHFDEALKGERAVPEDTTVVLVNYLQITSNTVEVED